MVAETKLDKSMFMFPVFVTHGKEVKREVPSMPSIFNFSPDVLLPHVESWLKIGINKIVLFGVGEEKSLDAENAYSTHSIIPETIQLLKKNFSDDIFIATDVCLCAYTSHGHCGILNHHKIDNDASVEILSKMALSHAQAGADMVSPSDMMDGRISAIRQKFDEHNFVDVSIMSYAVKYASSYYGPFRDAADSAPQFGDRKTYQMDYRNVNEAKREAQLDEVEGADVIMVKPAIAYLDVIKTVKENTNLPIACYNVSGEYAMVKAASEKGWINEQKIVMENMYAFARAGANIIISYHTEKIFKEGWL
jgi:porphobilinogen synthase